ncbi:IclR family transcriptional regulator domain-containing protein [Streptomyces sp. IGB124]|uniref:IclR family transcriptional regulator domain-containing protein n=1 Tax=Streptomyces sp. IGB124 TaxID=1519485 RepID=UPI0006AE0CA2|nr:IclR family transcriptional regulator C-terminal domain-containing protein [Streptomyces sp. IGB124]
MSRYEGPSGGAQGPDPVVPAGLADLLDQLAGPKDVWDRPDGDFGPLDDSYGLSQEEREHANSMYRLGSKALARGDLLRAANWLGSAAEAGHPGAMFRMAAVTSRAGGAVDDVRFLVAEAARHGHGDAERLLAGTVGRRISGTWTMQDPEFFDEVRIGMGKPLVLHTGHGDENPGGAGGSSTRADGPRLVLLPQTRTEQAGLRPVPGRPAGLRPIPASGTTRPTAGQTPIVQPDPEELRRPDAATPPTPRVAEARDGDGGAWVVGALRPAALTEMSRSRLVPADTAQQWKAAVRALDLLLHIEAAQGIASRTLRRRAQLSAAALDLLLELLRSQQLVTTVSGVHFPGPVLAMARRGDPPERLVQQSLDRLRDQTRAAIYISTYAGGQVVVPHYSEGPLAPGVQQWVDFRDTAHASANGKALLSQLTFEGRMDHLTRHQQIKLTDHTITTSRELFDALDGGGPRAAQYDYREYSRRNVCVAYSVGTPGKATCVALSLPSGEEHRLRQAARVLRAHSAGLLLSLLLAEQAGSRPPLSMADQAPLEGPGAQVRLTARR